MELREQHGGTTQTDATVQGKRQTEGVEERQHAVPSFFAFAQLRHPRHIRHQIRHQVTVSQNHRFGFPGGSTGVQQHRGQIRVNAGDVVIGLVLVLQQLVEILEAFLGVQIQHLVARFPGLLYRQAQRQAVVPRQSLSHIDRNQRHPKGFGYRLDVGGDLLPHQRHHGFGVLELPLQFGRSRHRVVQHRHRAQLPAGIERENHLGAVG